jgi:hypothetical protein
MIRTLTAAQLDTLELDKAHAWSLGDGIDVTIVDRARISAIPN